MIDCAQIRLMYSISAFTTLKMRYLENLLPKSFRYSIEKLVMPMKKNLSTYTFNLMLLYILYKKKAVAI